MPPLRTTTPLFRPSLVIDDAKLAATSSSGPRQHYCRRPVQYGLGSPSSRQAKHLLTADKLEEGPSALHNGRQHPRKNGSTPATATKSTVLYLAAVNNMGHIYSLL
jgi:hypothetical protein